MRRVSLALVLSALFALPTWAQEQRGTIEGQVKDAQGGVLPGVTVTAKSSALPAGTSSVTDADGMYRFPGLPPGKYEVTADLQGFNAAKSADIELGLGQIKKVALTMSPAGVSETIQVVAESPLIDVKQSAAFSNIHKEFIDKIPKGRDFTSVVTVAPGANAESKLGGISIDGASGAENVYVIDGINTTSIRTGQSAKGLITDFVEEVQVKSSGYNAEFGGAMGGVINVITRSGSNQFHGEVGSYFGGGNPLAANSPAGFGKGSVRPTLRLNPSNTTVAEYITYPDDTVSRIEPGGQIGGPILRDKLWFFAGYQPSLQSWDRTAPYSNGTSATLNRKDRTQNFTANANSQITDKLRVKFAANVDDGFRDNVLQNQDGTTSALANLAYDQRTPGRTYSSQVDYVANNRLYISGRVGYFNYDIHDEGIANEIRYVHIRSSIGYAAVPADLQRLNNFANIPTNTSNTFDKYTRVGVNFDTTYFANFAGQHTFKGGIQLDRYANNALTGELQPRVNIYLSPTETFTDLNGVVSRGAFGYYSWRQFQTTGDISSNALGFYFQDSWSVNNKLTLNAGIRTERERVPSYTTAHGEEEFAIDFGFKEKLAPRVGAAYDIFGNGKWKAYGSWGTFYDITKLEMPRGSFGGDKWLEYYYTLDTVNWNTLGVNGNWPGRFIEVRDFRHTGNSPGACSTPAAPNANCIDPALDPSKLQEATLGLDHELNARTSVGVRYVHKQIDRTIDDVGTLVPGVGEVYFLANPGYGLAEFTIGRNFPAQPAAQRDYDAVEFKMRRRMSDGLLVNASYTWSRLFGNFSGLASSDENGRSSPNVNRFFDGIYMSFDQFGNPTNGNLGTDRPHQVKVQAVYDFPFGTTLGATMFVASGTPISRQVSNQGLPFFYLGRGSEGRTPTFSQTNLMAMHEIRFGGQRVQLMADIQNLFDQDTVTDIFNTELRTNLNIPNAAFFAPGGFDVQQLIVAQGSTRDARFLMDSVFQARRAIRVGVKFLF